MVCFNIHIFTVFGNYLYNSLEFQYTCNKVIMSYLNSAFDSEIIYNMIHSECYDLPEFNNTKSSIYWIKVKLGKILNYIIHLHEIRV